MTTTTLVWVADDHREYDTKYGRKAAFKVKLEDGRLGEVSTNAETVEKRQTEFKDLIGKPTDLVIEDAGTWDDGNPRPVKVKLPQQPFGGAERTPRDETGMAIGSAGHDAAAIVAALVMNGTLTTPDAARQYYNLLTQKIYEHNQELRKSTGSPVYSGQSAATTTPSAVTQSVARAAAGDVEAGVRDDGEGVKDPCSHVFKGGKCKFCGEANPWA